LKSRFTPIVTIPAIENTKGYLAQSPVIDFYLLAEDFAVI
jgi:hypothetical protein